MPRPRKWRKVCCMPDSSWYGPLDSDTDKGAAVHMSVDEYETIRLIDAEGYTQEECAEQMNVSRSTVQSIYNNARKKLSESLVYGKALWIEGGDYRLCDGASRGCGGGGCHRHRYGREFAPEMETDQRGRGKETENFNENRDTDE